MVINQYVFHISSVEIVKFMQKNIRFSGNFFHNSVILVYKITQLRHKIPPE